MAQRESIHLSSPMARARGFKVGGCWLPRVYSVHRQLVHLQGWGGDVGNRGEPSRVICATDIGAHQPYSRSSSVSPPEPL